MSNLVWTTKDGQKLQLRDMETSHINNCIRMLERDMPEFEDDDTIVADHWSLTGVVVLPGARSYRETIKEFESELRRRDGLRAEIRASLGLTANHTDSDTQSLGNVSGGRSE